VIAFRRFLSSGWAHAILVVVALAVGYGMAPGSAGGDHHPAEHAHDHTLSGPSPAAALLASAGAPPVFTCVMHPHVRQPAPGQCPICGMGLIPVAVGSAPDRRRSDAEERHVDEIEPPQLRVTARAAALMQIVVRPAERRLVQVPVRVFGRLDHDETQLRTIAAWVPGRLDRLHVDFAGVAVRQGQPMVQLYSPQLIAAQEELLQALQADQELAAEGVGVVRESARLMVEASRDRLRLLGVDDAHIQRIESQGRVEDHVTIPAPVSGTVIERLASVGDYVDTGEPIYRVADLSRLWAQLEVYESDLQWLAVGQPAFFGTQSYPGEQFAGRVAFIDPTLNERTRTARVRVAVANPDGRLKPGMFVRGTIDSDAHGQADSARPPLVIPVSAPLITGRRAVVYVQLGGRESPTYEPRDVLLGPRAGDWYIVGEGLEEGELVVTNGAFKLDSELQIRGLSSMMQPEGGRPPVHDHGAQEPGRQAAPPAVPPDHQNHGS
jgi:membrane fusion protein, copper/silver efflux system